ncbi:MAG: hypothetical protein NTY48_01320, partial [Candidatus Diapherotrites archaeon]|nr:hypothetical protein [Candidatus Diapherotrites archaeon]
KGLVYYALVGKRKTYEATEPKRFLSVIEEKKRIIEEALPLLNSQRAIAKAPQEAIILKDQIGIRNIFVDMTKSKTNICLFASGWGFKETFPDYYDVWHQRLAENGKVLLTVMSSKFLGQDKEVPNIYKIRYLPSQFVFPSTTAVYEDKVFIAMWSKSPIGILIRGKEIAESYKQYFNLLWKASKTRIQIEKKKKKQKIKLFQYSNK